MNVKERLLEFFLTLRARIFFLTLAVCAVLLASLGFSALVDRQKEVDHARSHLVSAAQLSVARYAKPIEYTQEFLRHLVERHEIGTLAQASDCQELLGRYLRSEPRFSDIALIRPSGDYLCGALPLPAGASIADRDFFRQSLGSTGLVVGPPGNGAVSDQPILPFLQAVRDRDGTVIALLYVSLKLGWFSEEFARLGLQPGQRSELIDSKGRILARYPDAEGETGQNVSGSPLFEKLVVQGGQGSFEVVDPDQTTQIWGVVPFARTTDGPVWLAIGVPKSVVTAEADSEFARSLIAAFAVTALIMLTLWKGDKHLLLRPIAALSEAASRLRNGDMSARAGLTAANGELGELARSFDQMASALEAKGRQMVMARRAIKVLSNWNQDLGPYPDETDLANAMCASLVEAGGYYGAWVGFATKDKLQPVRPVAWWGIPAEAVNALGAAQLGSAGRRCPAFTAIGSGASVIVNDIPHDDSAGVWRDDALRFGYNSIAALPLMLDGRAFGALVIYATETFADEESVLFEEVAASLAGAVSASRARSERDRLLASLESSEEQYRAAAAASLDALLVLRAVRDASGEITDFRISEVNARGEILLGLSRDGAIGSLTCDALPVLRTAGIFPVYVEVANSGTPARQEFRVDTGDGSSQWWRQQIVRVEDGVAVSSRDVTAWKEASDRLRESEERMRMASEADHMGSWSWNVAGDTVSLSEGIGAFFGVPSVPSPCTSGAFLQAVAPGARDAMEEFFSSALRGNVPASREYKLRWPDGTDRWFEIRGDIFKGDNADDIRVVGVVRDVTDHNRAVSAVRRANRSLRTLSVVNELMTRVTDESDLLKRVCRAIVEEGGHRGAAVGMSPDAADSRVEIKAFTGIDGDYFREASRLWGAGDSRVGTITLAIRSGRPEVVQEIATDPRFAAMREAALARGLAANVALPLKSGAETVGALTIFSSEPNAFDEQEVALLEDLASDLAFGIVTLRVRADRDRIAFENRHHEEILRQSLENTVKAISDTVEMRDPYTAGHQRRVGDLSVAIAREFGLPEDRIQGLRLAASIHDLGKIVAPAEILAKPNRLTDVEYMLIKEHAAAGFNIVKEIKFPWPIATMIHQHHERMDGSGYPLGLVAGEILLESRILAVSDVVESMASHRPYRPALGIDAALAEIERGRGTLYDTKVVDICARLFRQGRFSFDD